MNTKIRLKILKAMLIYGCLGGIIWLIIGRFLFPSISSLLCFIGYPALFIGFYWTIIKEK